MEKSITAPDYAVFLRELRTARKAAGLNQTDWRFASARRSRS